jgi:signal peptidase complex subunit 3
MWDRIVRRKEDALIDVVAPPKYPLRDVRYSFKCVPFFIVQNWPTNVIYRKTSPVQFALKYNLMPYVGMLTYGEAARTGSEPFPPKVERL